MNHTRNNEKAIVNEPNEDELEELVSEKIDEKLDGAIDDKIKEISWQLFKHSRHIEVSGGEIEVIHLREEIDQLKQEVQALTQISHEQLQVESDRDFDFIVRNRSELEKYEGRYVAISNGQIIGSGQTAKEALGKALEFDKDADPLIHLVPRSRGFQI